MVLNNTNTSSNSINSNTPRAVAPNDIALFPSGFSVVEMVCINSTGAQYNINPLVRSFTITEELFSPLLVLSLKLRDDMNFFETFALNGEEKIYLHVRRKVYVNKSLEEEEFRLSFAVKEYPNYSKSAQQPNVQEYDIIAVSDFGYVSVLMKMSKAVDGNPVDNIKKILSEKLRTESELVGNTSCVSTFKGIITISSPLRAVEWLRSKAFDDVGSPFFVYSNMYNNDKVQIRSLSDMWKKSNPVMRTYEYRPLVENPVSSKYYYAENVSRILDMRSNIKLDKLDVATRGAFASLVTTTDIATKTINSEIFNISKSEGVTGVQLNTNKSYSSIGGMLSRAFLGNKSEGAEKPKSLAEQWEATLTNLSTNSGVFANGESNSTGIKAGNAAHAKSFYALFDNVNHQIIVYGDFKLAVGKKIMIKIPKSINRENTIKEGRDAIDEAMSGEYIIAVAAHTFVDGRYTTKLKLIRNTI